MTTPQAAARWRADYLLGDRRTPHPDDVSPLRWVTDTLAVNRAPLVYLSGGVAPLASGPCPFVGIMFQPGHGNRPDLAGVPWALDNGCFGKGEAFDGDAFLRLLDQPYWHRHRATCRFVVAPDVVCDAAATLRRAAWWLPRLRETGLPVAFVGQNGLDHRDVPWEAFDAFFLGGDDAWKLGKDAHYLAVEARHRGKAVHMGRVNSRKRLLHAARIGCHTVDGTYLAFGPDKNSPTLLDWMGDAAYYRRPGDRPV